MLTLITAVGFACQSQDQSAEPAQAAAPKQMDRVREGIITVNQQLTATLSSAEQASVSGNAASFREKFRVADASVKTLRTDAADLRERAEEHLALWSGRKVGSADDGYVQVVTDPRWQKRKEVYDQMVSALQSARDEILPLMSDLEKLQAGNGADGKVADKQAFGRAVQRARHQQTRAAAHLQTGVDKLDELATLMASARGSSTK